METYHKSKSLFSKKLYMKFFYETYINTINPKNDYNVLLSKNVSISIMVHLILYLVSYFLITELFDLPKKFGLIVSSLTIIMVLGYYFRLKRSKSLFEFYKDVGFSDKNAMINTMNSMHHAYFTWYFMA